MNIWYDNEKNAVKINNIDRVYSNPSGFWNSK